MKIPNIGYVFCSIHFNWRGTGRKDGNRQREAKKEEVKEEIKKDGGKKKRKEYCEERQTLNIFLQIMYSTISKNKVLHKYIKLQVQ